MADSQSAKTKSAKPINHNEGHRMRLKNRFLKHGLETFEPHEVLELLLFYALPRKDTNKIAHSLIEKYGSLPGVLDADFDDLCKQDGIGENAASLLTLIPQLSRYYSIQTIAARDRAPQLMSTNEIGEYLKAYFVGCTCERLVMLMLNGVRNPLGIEVLAEGSVNNVPADIRKIITMSTYKKASGIVLAHNHPSSLALPSPADIQLTRAIESTLSSINVTLIDHLIFDFGDFTSMRDSGFFLR